MNFIMRWWKNRHHHGYQETKIGAEAWGCPAFLVQSKCNCGKTFYYMSTVLGVQNVDQTWSSNIFNPQ